MFLLCVCTLERPDGRGLLGGNVIVRSGLEDIVGLLLSIPAGGCATLSESFMILVVRARVAEVRLAISGIEGGGVGSNTGSTDVVDTMVVGTRKTPACNVCGGSKSGIEKTVHVAHAGLR